MWVTVLAGLAWGAIPVVVGVGFCVDRLRRRPQGRAWEHCWVCGARGPYGQLADARVCCHPCRMDVWDEVDEALGINPVSNSDPGVPRQLMVYRWQAPQTVPGQAAIKGVFEERSWNLPLPAPPGFEDAPSELEDLPFVTLGQASRGRM